MNKIAGAVLGLLLIVSGASAQITLTQSSYPTSVLGTDSLKMTVYSSAFPPLNAMTAGLWDLSTVIDSTPLFYILHVPDVTYQYGDSCNKYIAERFNYQGNTQCSVDIAGILEYGINIKRDSIDLLSLTGGSTDTLIINAQNMAYSAPRTKVAFPATYNTKWSSVYSSDLAIDLSVASLGYSHAPGFIRRYTTQQDTVIGWGKMRVKDAVGVPSDSFNVLQVQTTITTVDSFFLNGLPFSNLLLLTLILNQGATDTIYQQNYYQPQEIVPLAEVTFTDATYAQPKSAVTHVKHMIGTTAIADQRSGKRYSVYPNPVSGNVLFVDLPNDTKDGLSYVLIDAAGKAITQGKRNASGSHAALTLPATTAPGTYYLRLKGENGINEILPVDVIK